MTVVVGTAGWSIPAAVRDRFGDGTSLLQRYARVLAGVEINTSFYRPHKRAIYQRWADAVPADFRFAVKIPKSISHERRLSDCGELLDTFLEQIAGLGNKLGPLLLQLPPSFVFDLAIALPFFARLRDRHAGLVACEPRHPSWFDAAANAALLEWRIARVAADPPAGGAEAARPGGDPSLFYLRLHGTPLVYKSAYDPADLLQRAAALQAHPAQSKWCIFDNTTLGAALPNALSLIELLGEKRPGD